MLKYSYIYFSEDKDGLIMKDTMLAYFQEVFGDATGARVFFAPGRVNLIGEHTDYNGGHVFPCSLTIGTYAAVRLREDDQLNFFSANFKDLGVIHSSLEELTYKKEDNWANYPKGTVWAFSEHGYHTTKGMDIVYFGNIPNSSGLSSSASIEVLTGFIIREYFGFDVDLVKVSLLCQYAENKFIGVNCGIMDQFAIAMGKKNHAIFLDTSNLEYTYAPIELGDAKLVIACSNKKRGLGDSKYNERRSQCEEALSRLKKVVQIETLGDLSEEEFEAHKSIIEDEVLIQRAKHAVYENQRTVRAVEALLNNDLTLFGLLMNASHVSLKNDYEVTGIELDTLVETAWTIDGVIGARMTGAGFGGCTVNIVNDHAIDHFINEVGKVYLEKIGYAADFYVVEVGNGPMEILA